MLSEKWILGFFHSDGSGSTMSGIPTGFIGQHKQAAADVLYQFVKLPPAKLARPMLPSNNTSPKTSAVIGFAVIYQAARKVARHVNSLQLAVAKGDDISVVQISPRGTWTSCSWNRTCPALLGSLLNPELVCFVGFGRQPNSFSINGLPNIWSKWRWVFSRCFTFSSLLRIKFFSVRFSSS